MITQLTACFCFDLNSATECTRCTEHNSLEFDCYDYGFIIFELFAIIKVFQVLCGNTSCLNFVDLYVQIPYNAVPYNKKMWKTYND